ncbi:TRAP transporter substrate-binding protein DctP [bacterium]|nr:TRAP transporter substrate-binding protein DctP [bacterium]
MLKTCIFIFSFIILASCSQEDKSLSNNKQVTVSLGHNLPETSNKHIVLVYWDSLLNIHTKGQVRLQIFPNQKLGTDQQMVQKVLRQELDIALPPLAKLSKVAPKVDLINTPYILSTESDYSNALKSHLGDYINEELLKSNLIGLGFIHFGMKYLSSNLAITESSKLRVRTMKSQVINKHYMMLNYKPLNIDFHFINKAIQNNDIDAQENPLASIYHMKLYKNQKFLYNSKHSILASAFVTHKDLESKIGVHNWEHFQSTLNQAINLHLKYIKQDQSTHLKKIKEGLTYFDSVPSNFIRKSIAFRDSVLKANPDFKKIILNSPSESDLIMGLDLSLEGATMNSGKSIQAGVEIALEEINSIGYTHNQKIRSIPLNNSGFPNRGIKNLNNLLNKKQLVSVMTGMHSPVALKQLEIIHKNNIPFLVPWAAATPIISNNFTPNWAFRLSVRDEYAGEFLVKSALNQKYDKISLVLEDTPWGRSNYKSMTQALQKRGLQANSIEWFNWGTQNFQDILNRFDKIKSDAIIFVGNAPEGIALLKSVQKNKSTQPIFSHWGITGGDFFEKTKDILKTTNLMFLQTFTLPTKPTPKQKKFITKLRKRLDLKDSQPIPAPVGAIHSYDLTFLFVKALQNSPDLTPGEIHRAIKNLKTHKGLFKTYNQPFRGLHEALNIKDFSLCQYDSLGNIYKVSK